MAKKQAEAFSILVARLCPDTTLSDVTASSRVTISPKGRSSGLQINTVQTALEIKADIPDRKHLVTSDKPKSQDSLNFIPQTRIFEEK